MPLKRLVELHERIADRLEPEHHLKRRVKWIIDLSPEGDFLGFINTTGDDKRAREYVVPNRKRQAPATPILLADRPDYVLGLGLGERNAEADGNHVSFVALTEKCARACEEPAVSAVHKFLEETIEDAREAAPTDLAPADLCAFRVGESLVTDIPSVQTWWQQHMTEDAGGKNTLEGECLLCGTFGPIAKRHPVAMKLGGSQVQIISADKDAFESYDLESSEIAPVCLPCVLRYGQTANYLMTSPDHHYRAGGVHYLYWTRSGGGGGVFSLLQEPQPEEVRQLLQTPFKPGQSGDVEEEAFYSLAVTTNMTRLIVRDWLETTIGAVQGNLARYFELQQLVNPYGEPFEPVGLYALATSLVRRADDLSPQIMPALVGAALHGHPLPVYLLHQAVRRSHSDADNRVTRPRVMLIKMVLNSQPESERRYPMVQERLDGENRHPAYLCGRLLRLLEEAQEAAIPGANATIVDRFFGTAATAPASVFGRLMRGSQNHLAKLRRDHPGTYRALQARIEEVAGQLPAFPKVLDLTAQGLFILGYYHQRANDRAEAKVRSEERKAKPETEE